MPASEISASLFGSNGADPTAEYLRLVREDLPAAARAAALAGHPWPIRLDHCFMRVVLDDVFGRPWRDALTGRGAAYRQLSAEQLARAIETARSMLDGGVDRVAGLNAASLRGRGRAGERNRPGPPASLCGIRSHATARLVRSTASSRSRSES